MAVAETVRKEPGRADVVQRERGDLRQHDNPINRQRDRTNTTSQDDPPARPDRGPESPWMGGG